MARALFGIVLLFLVAHVTCQDVGYTLFQQQADTVISDIICDMNSGYFTMTIYNGYVEEKVFYLEGQTDGVGSPLFPLPLQTTIPPRQYGSLFLYGPTNTGAGSRTIVGARSIISAWIVNYDNPTPASMFSSISTVCGNATGPCQCGFFEIGCQWSGGCGVEDYYMFWFFLSIGVFLVFAVLGHLVCSVYPAVSARSGALNAKQNLMNTTKDGIDAKYYDYSNKLKYGGSTREQYQSELRQAEEELRNRAGERDEVSRLERERLGVNSGANYDDSNDDYGGMRHSEYLMQL
jgi:hypothetical protein